MPETPVDRFLEPVRHFDQRGGIGRRDEGPDRLVIQEGAEQLIEVMRTHGIRRRCEGEQVVECRRHLEGALVSVAHHTGDPARIAARPRTTRATSSARLRTTTWSGLELSV